MPLSYEYAIGSVRAKENSLFSKADLEAMLALGSTDALLGYLRDKGYPDADSVEDMLKESAAETARYLNSIVPDPSVFDVFYYVNDAHNIKSVIKGLLAGIDYGRLFTAPCTVDTALIETAVKENKYSLLPEYFADAAKKAYEVLAHTADARLADAYLDTACMQAQLDKAKETGVAFLEQYLQTEIFYRNVKLALRAAMTGAPSDYYEIALLDLNAYEKKEVVKAALKGENEVVEYFSAKDIFQSRAAMEHYKNTPAEFEKFTEDLLMALAITHCRRGGTGAEAALGYYLGMAAQNKAINIIAVGIQTGADSAITRERLREIYG